MDHQPPGVKFAIIGHQDSWEHVMQFVNSIRLAGNNDILSVDKIKQVYSHIPPRNLFHITVHSEACGPVRGVYIETFISPDELGTAHIRKNISKVKQACTYAADLGASVVSLGGFSSIVLETCNESFTRINDTYFTTGNSLTAGFISRGIEKACTFWNAPLERSRVLIIGSTGDIGSACVRYFSGKVRELLLCARQAGPLKTQSEELTIKRVKHTSSSCLQDLVPKADIVISVASSIIDEHDLDLLPKNAIICDAGYPKNLQALHLQLHERSFYGGMGIVKGGFRFDNNIHHSLYKFPVHNASHGCLLESTVLAMEGKYSAYSQGKGNISIHAMEEILGIAKSHGVETAPLFNGHTIFEKAHHESYE